MPTNFHFDIIAPFYDRFSTPRQIRAWKDLLKLPISGWMLDAGGGTGRTSMLLRPLVGHLVLSDLSLAMLRQAEQKEVFDLLCSSAQHIPFVDNTFERIIIVEALHHIHDQALAIQNLVRVLKPGGRLVIEEPDIDLWQVKLVGLVEKILLMESHIHTATEIQDMVAKTGCKSTVERTEEYSIWVIVEK